MLHAYLVVGGLVLADDYCERRPARIGFFHLHLEAAAAAVLHHRQALVTQLLGHAEGHAVGGTALVHDIDFALGRGLRRARFLHQRKQPLQPHGKTAGRRGLAADLLEQPVVASAAAHRALGAQAVGHPLEHGEIVVVQTAHHARVDAVGNADVLQHLLHPFEMRQRGLAQMVQQPRRRLDQRLHQRVFAVEHAQRIGMHAAPGVFIQRLLVRLQILHQFGAVSQALFRAADGIELQLDIVKPEVVPQPRAHQQQLGIHIRAGIAQGFRADLMELAVASLLRPLMPVHGPHVIQPLRIAIEQIVLDCRAHR